MLIKMEKRVLNAFLTQTIFVTSWKRKVKCRCEK